MKKTVSLLPLVILVPLIGACNKSNEPKEGTFTVIDAQNREVTIDRNKRSRVICLGAGALRMYSYICGNEGLVAVEEIDKTPFGVGTALRPYHLANKDFYASLPTCGKGGPQAQAPDYEAIAANRPEVIVSIYSDPALNNEISSRLNVPVIGLSQGPEAIFDATTIKSLNVLGEVFGKEKRSQELVSYINSCKSDFSTLTMTEETYYAGCIGNWGKTNMTGSFKKFPVFDYAKVNAPVDSMTFINKDSEIKRGQVTVDLEKFVDMNPDKIFVDGAGFAGFLAEYKSNPETKAKYDSLKAFKNGEIYSLLPYNAYYTNLEIQIISTYYVASVAHPNSFVNFDISKKADEVTKKFLGKELYKDMCAYDTSLGGYQKINIADLAK